jgi:hypothetical protein
MIELDCSESGRYLVERQALDEHYTKKGKARQDTASPSFRYQVILKLDQVNDRQSVAKIGE